jgi:hypothetical protein
MIHEYVCRDCETCFHLVASVIVQFVTCPNCHSKNIKRIYFKPKRILNKVNE